MRSTKFIIPVFMIAAAALFGCNDKSDSIKKDLSKQWQMMGIGGAGAVKIPDSIKLKMYGTRFMEFTDKGEMIATSQGVHEVRRGDYTIGDDGKTMFTTRNGRASDTMVINKLTKDSLILFIKGANIETTWIPK